MDHGARAFERYEGIESCHMHLILPCPYFLKMSNCLKATFGIEEMVEVKPAECRRVPLLKVAVADFRYFVEIGTAICMKPQLGLQWGVLFLTPSLRRQTEIRIDRASFLAIPPFLVRSPSASDPKCFARTTEMAGCAGRLLAVCNVYGCTVWDRARGATKLPNQLSEIDARCLVNCPQCKGWPTPSKQKRGSWPLTLPKVDGGGV
jgi:hypothetical protein